MSRCARARRRASAARIAGELRAHGVDFSFTPVLDVDHGESAVIGDRAFHRNPNAIAHLASALCDGLRAGGMAAVGKHFPGHGHVAADSHTELPVDDRPLAAIVADDLVPFGALIARGLEAIMPAHVVYPAIDKDPAGFSRNGCARSCADGSASTASSFPTISAWRARKVSAISSPGRRRRSPRGATWCSPATISRPRTRCSQRGAPSPDTTSRGAPPGWNCAPRGRRGSVRRHCGPRRNVRLHRANLSVTWQGDLV